MALIPKTFSRVRARVKSFSKKSLIPHLFAFIYLFINKVKGEGCPFHLSLLFGDFMGLNS